MHDYLLQDHLGGTSVIADTGGNSIATMRYYPFGGTRSSSGAMPTDKRFTGQRLDQTGLYYYGARYYDAAIGRFISPDTIVPDPMNAQTLNRYSYCLNNPLRYIDPSGHEVNIMGYDVSVLNSMSAYDQGEFAFQIPAGEAGTQFLTLWGAWNSYSDENPKRAASLEASLNTLKYTFGNINNSHDYRITITGKNTTIIINSDESHDLSGVNTFFLSALIEETSDYFKPIVSEQEIQMYLSAGKFLFGAGQIAAGIVAVSGSIYDPQGLWIGCSLMVSGYNNMVNALGLGRYQSPFLIGPYGYPSIFRPNTGYK